MMKDEVEAAIDDLLEGNLVCIIFVIPLPVMTNIEIIQQCKDELNVTGIQDKARLFIVSDNLEVLIKDSNNKDIYRKCLSNDEARSLYNECNSNGLHRIICYDRPYWS